MSQSWLSSVTFKDSVGSQALQNVQHYTNACISDKSLWPTKVYFSPKLPSQKFLPSGRTLPEKLIVAHFQL